MALAVTPLEFRLQAAVLRRRQQKNRLKAELQQLGDLSTIHVTAESNAPAGYDERLCDSSSFGLHVRLIFTARSRFDALGKTTWITAA